MTFWKAVVHFFSDHMFTKVEIFYSAKIYNFLPNVSKKWFLIVSTTPLDSPMTSQNASFGQDKKTKYKRILLFSKHV